MLDKDKSSRCLVATLKFIYRGTDVTLNNDFRTALSFPTRSLADSCLRLIRSDITNNTFSYRLDVVAECTASVCNSDPSLFLLS